MILYQITSYERVSVIILGKKIELNSFEIMYMCGKCINFNVQLKRISRVEYFPPLNIKLASSFFAVQFSFNYDN